MRIAVLDRNGDGAFRHMTFPAFRPLLAQDAPNVLAIGCFAGDHPVGLGLAVREAGGPASRLLSLHVEPAHRGRGVATQLVAATENVLMSAGACEVVAKYMSGLPSAEALEAVLRKRGFDDPVARMLVVRCTLNSVRNAPWLKQHALPSGWDLIRWVDVTETERATLRDTYRNEAWFGEDLDPFEHEAGLEPLTSLALRCDGVVCGWLITHVVEGALRFTCGFVRPDLQRSGRMLVLWSAAVARAPLIGMSEAMWTVPMARADMVRFARRRMRPFATFFGETRVARKALAPLASRADAPMFSGMAHVPA